MRIGLIFCVLALTAGVFFAAIQTLPAEVTSAQASTGDVAQEAKLAQTEKENLSLQTVVAELEEKNSTLLSQLEGARAETEKHEIALAALEAKDAERLASESDANTALSESLSALQDKLSVTELAYNNIKDDAQSKGAEISQAQETIAALEANIAELERTRDVSATRITELEDELKKPVETEGTELQAAAIAERDSALAELAALKKETEDQTRFTANMTDLVAAMKKRISTLQSDVSAHETTIAALEASSQIAVTSPTALCQERSDALTSAINFEGGTTSISTENISLLEELTNVVAECVQQDVVLEIEGHTDNSRGAASNLLLSNGRANAVLTFLVERGIPADSMRAVGFGSSDPVADNTTADGRLLNQRIVFDWEVR
ncbi:MAG: OmpA family protein [Paracoccaceae bacterium]